MRNLEVGVCGCSLFLAGIKISLQAREGMRVRRLGDSLAESFGEIKMLFPHVVIFEMNAVEQSAIANIMRKIPHTMLIGLEAESESITVFSASEQRVSSMDELAKMIFKRACEKENWDAKADQTAGE
jgi:hypothetical protein